MKDYIVNKIKNEPAVVTGAIVSAVVLVAAKYNIIIDSVALEAALLPVVTGLSARFFVVPTNKVPGEKPGV